MCPERRIFFLCVLEGGRALAWCACVRPCVRACVRASAPSAPPADKFCSGVTFSNRFVGIMFPVQGFSLAVDSCRCPLHIFSMNNAGWRARSSIRPRPPADQFCSGVTFSKRFVGIAFLVQGFSCKLDTRAFPLQWRDSWSLK